MGTSQRLQLVAVGGIDAPGLAERLAGLSRDHFHSSHLWAWVRLNLDDPAAPGLDPGAVHAATEGLKGPVIEIYVEPGQFWTLSVRGEKLPPVRLAVHDRLLELLHNPAALKRVTSVADEVSRCDSAVDEAYRLPAEALSRAGGNSRKELNAVLKDQATRVEAALIKVKRLERGSGFVQAMLAAPGDGNVPVSLTGFFKAVRLGQVLNAPDSFRTLGPSGDEAGTFSDRVTPLADLAPPAVPIDGGPVSLDMDDIGRLWMIPWCCDTDVEVDLLVSAPGETWVNLPKAAKGVVYHQRGGRTYVEVGWQPPGPRFRLYRDLGRAVAEMPEGTVVEWVAGNGSESDEDNPPLRAGNQRYLGVIEVGRCRLSHAFPPVSADDLRSALDLLRSVDDPRGAFGLGSEAAARAVEARAASSAWFSGEDRPRADGSKVVCKGRDGRLPTALFTFRERFANGPWDVISCWKRDDDDEQSWDEMIENVSRKVGEALAAPAEGEVFLRTEHAVFRRADWSAMNVGAADALGYLWGRAAGLNEPVPQTPLEKLAPVDRALLGLGFIGLGDVHCDRFGELYLRGYAGPDGVSYAAVIAGTFGQFATDLVTAFADGATCTTSTTPDLNDHPKSRAFKRSFPDLDPAALFQRHRERVDSLASAHGGAESVEPTLEGFCLAIDAYIVREL